MLKIREVKYKLMDYGPDIGYPTIVVKFEPDSVDIKDDPDAVEHYDIYGDFISRINEQGLTDYYTRAIDGSLRCHFCFTGSAILLAKNQSLKDKLLFDGISQKSLDLQKDMRKNGMKVFGDIRPPFFMWSGLPKICTGTRLGYENFNTAYTVINADSDFSPIAVQEILNKDFSNVFIEYRDEKDYELYKELIEQFKFWKINFICARKDYERVTEICLKEGLRCWVTFNDDIDIEP